MPTTNINITHPEDIFEWADGTWVTREEAQYGYGPKSHDFMIHYVDSDRWNVLWNREMEFEEMMAEQNERFQEQKKEEERGFTTHTQVSDWDYFPF